MCACVWASRVSTSFLTFPALSHSCDPTAPSPHWLILPFNWAPCSAPCKGMFLRMAAACWLCIGDLRLRRSGDLSWADAEAVFTVFSDEQELNWSFQRSDTTVVMSALHIRLHPLMTCFKGAVSCCFSLFTETCYFWPVGESLFMKCKLLLDYFFQNQKKRHSELLVSVFGVPAVNPWLEQNRAMLHALVQRQYRYLHLSLTTVFLIYVNELEIVALLQLCNGQKHGSASILISFECSGK